jgi:N-acetylglucosamine-6-sulfatase
VRWRSGALVLALTAIIAGALGVAGPSSAPDAAGAGSPGAPLNVVLIVTDDQSLESLSVMDYVDGRSDWIRFDNAYLNNPICCPSRATILSGRYSHHTGVETNRDGSRFDDDSTLATWLDGAGYQTGLVGKYLNAYPFGRQPFVPPGWDRWYGFTKKGYTQYTLYEAGGSRPPRLRTYSKPNQYVTDLLAKKAKNVINGFAASDDPFFLLFTPNAPHAPRTPAARHLGDFARVPMPRSPNFDEADVSDKPEWVQDLPRIDRRAMDRKRREQYETLQSLDEAVRTLFETLQSNGVLDETVVVFMTDNGYSFGAHRWQTKICPYEECAATPFLVRYPGQSGRTEHQLISNVDLAPSIAAMAGAAPSGSIDGRNLVPILQNANPQWRDAVLLHGVRGNGFNADYWGVATESFKYVEYQNGDRELYDLEADPYELENVINVPSYDDEQQVLANRLAALKQ